MNECFRSTAIWIYKIKRWRGLNLLLSNANAGYMYCKELRWNKIKANESLFSHDLSVAHLRTENEFRYWLELTTACYQGDQIKLHYCWSLYFQLGNRKELQVTSVFLLAGQGIQKKQRTKATEVERCQQQQPHHKTSVCFTSSVFTTIGDLLSNPNPTGITGKCLIDSMSFESGSWHLILLSVFQGAELLLVPNDSWCLLITTIFDWHVWISLYTSPERLLMLYLVYMGENKIYKENPIPTISAKS